MPENHQAKRIIKTLTGPWEMRHLPKMAAALPRWVVPDHLTVLGILAAFVIGIGYALTRYSPPWLWLSNFGLFLHCTLTAWMAPWPESGISKEKGTVIL